MTRILEARGLGPAIALAGALAAGSSHALSRDALEAPEPPAVAAPAPEENLSAEDPLWLRDPDAADWSLAASEEPDPLEEMNRAVFGFNERMDGWVVEPAARAYGWVMPDLAERAVLRVFANLNSPSVFVNDLLRLDVRRAGITLGRFVINTTAGVAGILDLADDVGLRRHHADFGQTLANVGLGSGPYLVIPMLGPTTARDAVGGAVDMLFRPQTYFLGPAELIVIGTSNGLATRASYAQELEALRDSSLDFYATMRNLYFQRRADQLREIGVAAAEGESDAEVVER